MNLEFNTRSDTWRSARDRRRGDRYRCLSRSKAMAGAVSVLGLGIVIWLFSFFVFGGETPSSEITNVDTLKFAAILFRHGARTPTKTYNSDPYRDYAWPGGWGSLTNVGKMQLFKLGKRLRKQYTGFLPEEYLDRDIYVQSSDMPRTLMSASALLAGLYPPAGRQKWNPTLEWQPIPVHTTPKIYDHMLANAKNCPIFEKLYENATNSFYVKKIDENLKSQYDSLTLHCNETVKTILAVEFLYSTLKVESENGLTLPQWTEDLFPGEMETVYSRSLALFTYDTAMKRLRGGPLLSIILNVMQQTQTTKSQTRKMHLYSGHDLTIVNLWRTLGFDELISPDYGAILTLEMHSMAETTDSEIKVLYYSSSTAEPRRVIITKCGDPCTLTELLKITTDVIPVDLEKECKIP